MVFRLFILSCFVFTFSSCSSKKKKKQENVFTEESDFLANGNEVKIVENQAPVVVSRVKKIEDNQVVKTKIIKLKKQSHQKNVKEKILKSNVEENTKRSVEPEIIKNKEDYPFRVGEEVVLSARYFGVEAGKIKIGVKPFKRINGQEEVYHFYASGKTSSVFSLFYSLNDQIDALWNPETQKPVSLAFHMKETKQNYKARVYFDWSTQKADYLEQGWSKKKGEYKDKKVWNLPAQAQDIVSAIFYTRSLKLEVGKSYTYKVFENDKVIDVSMNVDRKEKLKTKVGVLNTLVLKPTFKTQGKFKKTGEISIWLTDDSYRQVVRFETKIKIGSVVASLSKMTRPN